MFDRSKRLAVFAMMAMAFAAPAMAQEARRDVVEPPTRSVASVAPASPEEPKRDIMPPVTGEGAGQTYAQAVWVIVIFVILLVILYPTAWKNVLAGLRKREDKIRADIADAEAARVKAEASVVEYNKQLATAETQVRELLAKAVADAERIATSIKMRAQEEVEAAKEKAAKEIEAGKQQALAEIYEQAANLATSVAEKILRREINADDQKSLVDETLRQMSTAGA